jgi:transposase-like protein
MHRVKQWRWHLGEVFMKIRGETHYLWHAEDHEGGVLEAYFMTQPLIRAACVETCASP